MTIFVVIESDYDDATTVHGCFSTSEKAQTWIDEYKKLHHSACLDIDEFILDERTIDQHIVYYAYEVSIETRKPTEWGMNGIAQKSFEPPFISEVNVNSRYINSRSIINSEHALKIANEALPKEVS